MVKKRKIKKKPVFVLLLIIFLTCFGLYKIINYGGKDKFKVTHLGGGNIQNKLVGFGYKEDEVKILMDKIPDNSYDESTLGKYGKNLWVIGKDENGRNITADTYPTAMTNGELPFAALVDGRNISTNNITIDTDRPKYKLRWYGVQANG